MSDLTGRRFGRLFVERSADQDRWWCRCDCGSRKLIWAAGLSSGTTKSCGCFRRERGRQMLTTHGLSHGATRSEYKTWQAMHQRCGNPRCHAYAGYGGRGIRVCQGWITFEAFFADMGQRPTPRHSIDRIDNDGGYACGKCHDCEARGAIANCRWATKKQQGRNRRDVRLYSYGGESQTLPDWAERLGIPDHVLRMRLKRGWSIERTLTAPLRITARSKCPS